MSRTPQVLIAGAGIAGLTLALALLRRGVSVQLHEQVTTLTEVGAGLQLSANATRCLFALGLEGALRNIASAPEGKEVRLWNTGQRWKLFDLGASCERSFGFPYLMVHRGDLHRLLLDAIENAGNGVVHQGSRCLGFEQDENGVDVLFQGGHRRRCGALVGADGVHSQVRAGLFGVQEPSFTGCMAWRGLVPADRLPSGFVRLVGVNWIGPGAHVVTYPLRGGRLVNFVGIVERDDWQIESWTELGTTAECAHDFAGWHDDVHELIRRIEQPFKWALMGREPLPALSRERVALMGDAAHPTLPFLAQGACMAIEDAIVLARAIAEADDDVATAFRRYDAARLTRTSRIVRGSAENAKRFHNPALATAAGAQTYVDEEWSEEKVRARYNWLFEYDALTTPLPDPVLPPAQLIEP